MTAFRDARILISGASGQFGRQVLGELLARGAADVTAGSRKPAGDLPAGVRSAMVDFDDPAGMEAAFAGVDRLLLISTDVLGVPGKRLAQHRAAIAAAAAAGVGHVVYTSMPQPGPGNPIPFAPDHQGSEQALAETGLTHTILRNNWYFENLVLGMPQAMASGMLFSAAGQGGLAQVARADLAAAAAGALLTEGATATYELSGPEAITAEAQVALFNAAFGTAIKVVHLDDDALAAGLRQAGLPEGLVGLLVGADQAIRGGRMDLVTPHVEHLSGRKPQRLADWLQANRALFA